jgi:putative iron-dependent peroxidase
MYSPQAGIFALGTSSHAYLEFDILAQANHKEFASAISAIREPRTTTGGVNFVIGFRPELWRDLAPADAPPDVEGFNQEIRGTEGFLMPSTQHDALVWLSGSAYDVIFDMARSVIRDLAGQASLAEETSSWPYRHDRDPPGSSTDRRIRHCSTPQPSPSCPKESPVPRAQFCCCRSGNTRSQHGRRSR